MAGSWRAGARLQREAFDSEAATLAARLFRDPGNGRTWRKKLAWIGERLWRIRPDGLYLEIGTGEGTFHAARELYPRRHVGVDPAARALVRARGRWPDPDGMESSRWIAGFAEELPFADATFDGVFGIDTIHHWADPAAGLREVARVLRPGAAAAFVEPNRRYPANLLLLASKVEWGIFGLSRARLAGWARAAGLTGIEVDHVAVFFPSLPSALFELYAAAERALDRVGWVRRWSTARTLYAVRPPAPGAAA